ncbi:MAG: DUF2384 domain-containing protein [Proteobacteria bacterium]|nr:MAG: DUF2384 domain-containing protein [Pseudomonadota bacterium]
MLDSLRSLSDAACTSADSISAVFELLADSEPQVRIAVLRKGLPATMLDPMASLIGWSREAAIEAFHLPRSTISRKIRLKQPLDLHSSERMLAVLDLIALVERLVKESGDPETKEVQEFVAARWLGNWLATPHPALLGEKPESYLDTHEGIRFIRRLLEQMQSGSYA